MDICAEVFLTIQKRVQGGPGANRGHVGCMLSHPCDRGWAGHGKVFRRASIPTRPPRTDTLTVGSEMPPPEPLPKRMRGNRESSSTGSASIVRWVRDPFSPRRRANEGSTVQDGPPREDTSSATTVLYVAYDKALVVGFAALVYVRHRGYGSFTASEMRV